MFGKTLAALGEFRKYFQLAFKFSFVFILFSGIWACFSCNFGMIFFNYPYKMWIWFKLTFHLRQFEVVNAASDQPLTAEEYDRVLNYLGELSKAKGIEDLWTKNQPEFQQITDDWKACAKKNRITRFLYVLRLHS